MKTLTRLSLDRPKAVVLGWLVILAVAMPFALQLTGALKAGGFSDPRGASVDAQETLEAAFDEAPNSLLIVLNGDDPAAVDAAVDTAGQAADREGVSAVVDRDDQPGWVSEDGRTTFLQVAFTSDNTTVQNLVPDVRDDVGEAVGPDVEVNVTGAPALDYALNMHSKDDVTRAELIAFPVLFVVLLLVFRSVAAMAVPLALAGVTLMITQAIGFAMTKVTDVNSLFTNIVTMVGLAVAVDYSLFIVKRFREELAEGLDVRRALERTMATVGHSVLFSGLAVVVALSALFVPRAMSFTSIALGGVAVSVIAVLMAITLLPAVLSLLGHRINWGSLRRRSRSGAAGSPTGDTGSAASADGNADAPRVTRFPGRPGVVLAGLAVGFTVLALPATQLTLRVPVASADILPASDEARVGMERIQEDIGIREMFPIQVVLTADEANAAELLETAGAVADRAAGLPGADEVRSVSDLPLGAAELTQALDGTLTLDDEAAAAVAQLVSTEDGSLVTRVMVIAAGDPDSSVAHDLVGELRSEVDDLTGTGVEAKIAGATATGSDFDSLVLRSAPVVVGFVALLSFLILLAAFRSVLLPLLALALNVAVVAASLGVLALVSGNGEQSINSVTPLMLFAVMFGLSMDYMVIMFSRMREMYLDGVPHRQAVLGGLARTAGLVNGAAAIMVAVFASFTSAQISIVRELGISLAVAVLLDAVVVRRLLMPAALLLIGERIWGRRPAGTAPTDPPAPIEAADGPDSLPPGAEVSSEADSPRSAAPALR
ncbi:putative drug exporter of the RND superfamily [Streptomyces zhaozhouensis]|uniref:Putative drug exporter of the RND superfamily n=1 Tax=Streptomyces zhaozhouensis TaxID=1300267 RepID=A0A286DP35_9ACTN|nr:MMPL family transporter [Streptomyces zhaozhouensis]SOD60442.1 putative drug exporter of the RND superfamily [Streptomyces zhaozhouensis]